MNEDCLKEEIVKTVVRLKTVKSKMVFDGVTHREFFALEILDKKTGGDIENYVNVSDLANCLKISMPQASRMLKYMEEKQYIQRYVDTKDRRNTYVILTELGKEKRKSAADGLNEYVNRVGVRMGVDNLKQLLELLKKLTDVMQDELNQK